MDDRTAKKEVQRLVGEMHVIVKERGDTTGVQATEAMQRLISLWQRDDELEDEMLSNALKGMAIIEEFKALTALLELDPLESGMTLHGMRVLRTRMRNLTQRAKRLSERVDRWREARDKLETDDAVVTAEMVALKARMEAEKRAD